MTELRPCPACRRHVALAETACPFCAVPLAPAASRALVRGRLSRAAVFATGALAATACGGAGKAKDAAPPPPVARDAAAAVAADAAPPPVDAAVAVDAAPIDAAAPPPDAPAKKKVQHPIPDHPNPKPYGAPPARRRIV